MPRPRKLDDVEVAAIRDWAARWRALPTRKQIAEKYSISVSLVDRLLAGYEYRPDTLTERELNGYAAELLQQTSRFT